MSASELARPSANPGLPEASIVRPATGKRYDPRTRLLLEAPITATLLRLAAPNVLVMMAQASVGLIETYFVGKLGTAALAGVALVFPVVMLMQMMSAGAMGGGISSAIARALGAGRRDDADALAFHALAIAVIFGLVFMLAVLGGGPWLYAAMGGSGPSLSAALTYSNVIFSSAILVWVFNSLANVIRGTGNMAVPAIVTCAGTAALIPLSPCLIFGWGPFPQLGVAGGAVAVVAFYALGSLALAAYLWSGRSVVRLSLRGNGFRWTLVLGHPARGCGRRADHRRDQSDDRHRDRPRRTVRRRRDRRLRHRLAPRISPHPSRVRIGRPARRHGRNQYRRRPARTRVADGLDRRRHRGRPLRDDRAVRRRLPASVARSVRHRSRHARRRIALSANGRSDSTACSGSAWRSTSLRRAPGACSGRCSRTSRAWRSRPAAAGSRCAGAVSCPTCLSRRARGTCRFRPDHCRRGGRRRLVRHAQLVVAAPCSSAGEAIEMTVRYLEDFAVGQTYGSGRRCIDSERIKTFASKCGRRRSITTARPCRCSSRT